MKNAYVFAIEVGPAAIDANGHVNNVEFVRWMQEAAVAHADERGCTAATRDCGATWVVRSHRIEYHRPAFAGDKLQVKTWVADIRRASSLRKYEFVRSADNTVLATGETDWVFIDVRTGRPRRVPNEIFAMFDLAGESGGEGRSSAH